LQIVHDIEEAKKGSWWSNPLSFVGRGAAAKRLYNYEIKEENRKNSGLDTIELFKKKGKTG